MAKTVAIKTTEVQVDLITTLEVGAKMKTLTIDAVCVGPDSWHTH